MMDYNMIANKLYVRVNMYTNGKICLVLKVQHMDGDEYYEFRPFRRDID